MLVKLIIYRPTLCVMLVKFIIQLAALWRTYVKLVIYLPALCVMPVEFVIYRREILKFPFK